METKYKYIHTSRKNIKSLLPIKGYIILDVGLILNSTFTTTSVQLW